MESKTDFIIQDVWPDLRERSIVRHFSFFGQVERVAFNEEKQTATVSFQNEVSRHLVLVGGMLLCRFSLEFWVFFPPDCPDFCFL